MTSISSATSSISYYQTSKFSRLDSDGDGKVSSDEFSAGKPSDVTAKQSGQLFASLDADGDGSLSEDDLNSGRTSSDPFAQMSGEAVAVMMQMQASANFSFAASDAYAAMDGDGDGSVTQAEFLSARPDDVSEKDALALYQSIDTDGAGSVTEDQFVSSLEQMGPGGPPPSDDDDTAAIFDALDANQDGVVSAEELAAAKPDDVSADDSASLFDALDEDASGGVSLDELESARRSFMASAPIHNGDGRQEGASDAQFILEALNGSADAVGA